MGARADEHSHIVMGRAPPLLRASLSRLALLRSSFSLAIREVMLSSIWPLKLGSLGRGPFPFSEAIHLAWEQLATHGMRRAALAVAAVGAGVDEAPRPLCRARRLSWDVMVGWSRGREDGSAT